MAGSAFANNEIYITQVGTSNNFTLDITQDGDDNVVQLSVSHDNNTIDIDQTGTNNTISWVSYWGSGQCQLCCCRVIQKVVLHYHHRLGLYLM